MKRRIIATVVLAVLGCTSALAQNVKDLVISEVQVDSVLLDNGYGVKAPWIEVFNNSYGTVKFGGCFISDDRTDLRKYFIPKTDNKTAVGPRQSVIFYADGKSDNGAFHTNFTLSRGKTVYLISNDGRTIVDSLAIPSDLQAGMSIAKFAGDPKAMVFDDIHAADPTPGSYNTAGGANQETKADRLKRTDPHGFTLTLISVCVVFLALVILYLCYTLVGAICMGKFKPKKSVKKKKAGKGNPDAETAAAIAMALQMENSGETEAAIALALDRYLSESVHDYESYIITIRRK